MRKAHLSIPTPPPKKKKNKGSKATQTKQTNKKLALFLELNECLKGTCFLFSGQTHGAKAKAALGDSYPHLVVLQISGLPWGSGRPGSCRCYSSLMLLSWRVWSFLGKPTSGSLRFDTLALRMLEKPSILEINHDLSWPKGCRHPNVKLEPLG